MIGNRHDRFRLRGRRNRRGGWRGRSLLRLLLGQSLGKGGGRQRLGQHQDDEGRGETLVDPRFGAFGGRDGARAARTGEMLRKRGQVSNSPIATTAGYPGGRAVVYGGNRRSAAAGAPARSPGKRRRKRPICHSVQSRRLARGPE